MASGLLFADNSILYRNIYLIRGCFILQEELAGLGHQEADWQMKFNVAKCSSMREARRLGRRPILFDYSLHNQALESVRSAKYLGIPISDNMDWGQNISEISSGATRTLCFLPRNLAFAPGSPGKVVCRALVSAWAGVCSARLEPLLWALDWSGRESSGDSSLLDLQEMVKHKWCLRDA